MKHEALHNIVNTLLFRSTNNTVRYAQEADTDEDEKTSGDGSSDSDGSEYSSDIYSLTLHDNGPEMVVLGTLRKV